MNMPHVGCKVEGGLWHMETDGHFRKQFCDRCGEEEIRNLAARPKEGRDPIADLLRHQAQGNGALAGLVAPPLISIQQEAAFHSQEAAFHSQEAVRRAAMDMDRMARQQQVLFQERYPDIMPVEDPKDV